MKTVNVSAIEHKDVRGQVKWYLQATTDNDQYIINVGEKTYKRISEMANNEVTNATTPVGENAKVVTQKPESKHTQK